jgi:hypothetical protein
MSSGMILKSNQQNLRPEILVKGMLRFYDGEVIARGNDAAIQNHEIIVLGAENNDTLLAASQSAKK